MFVTLKHIFSLSETPSFKVVGINYSKVFIYVGIYHYVIDWRSLLVENYIYYTQVIWYCTLTD